MKPRNIKYSEMYDKLKNRKKGGKYTTFRGYSPGKHRWYESNIEREFQILLTTKFRGQESVLGSAELMGMSFHWADEIPVSLVKMDTYEHYELQNWEDLMRKFYGVYPCFLICLNLQWTTITVNGTNEEV